MLLLTAIPHLEFFGEFFPEVLCCAESVDKTRLATLSRFVELQAVEKLRGKEMAARWGVGGVI